MDIIGDRYEIGRTLGAGGMARVVQAHDRLLDRQVAIKLLRDDIANDTTARERFLNEARTAARFNHPNAVTVFDTGMEGRTPWIAMELIHGEDLARRLATGGRLEETEAVAVADAVLAALEAAHRDGMIHRDVKPGNIMLLDDGGVKLADFGIAKSVQDATAGLTATGQIVGTAKYLSPEQVDGRPATPASDVYALGCVLYEMLTGTPPFDADTAIAIALAHTRDPVPDIRRARPGVSPAVAAAVMRSLEKDPAQRFADAGEMRRALRGDAVAAAYAPTEVVPETAATTRVLPAAPPPSRRRVPWLLLILGLLALLLALLMAVLTAATDDPEPDKRRRNRNPAPTEQQATDPPTQAPKQAPATEAPPPQEEAPPPPTDLPTLISLLEAQPDTYGPKQDDLRKGLEKVVDSEGDKQIEEATKLSDQIADWIAAGDLNSDIGNLALMLLSPYVPEDDGDGDKGQGGPPPGKGPDKDDDDD